MKRLFMLIVMAFNVLFTLQIKAGLFDGSVHFYIERGQSLTAETEIRIMYFNFYTDKVCFSRVKKMYVSKNLQTDRNFYSEENNYKWGNLSGKYQPSQSTSSRDVYGGRSYHTEFYSGPWYPGCPARTEVADNYYIYYGFANDKDSYIWWKEDLDGNILDKTYYMEVSIDDLLPKTVNRDFLYD